MLHHHQLFMCQNISECGKYLLLGKLLLLLSSYRAVLDHKNPITSVVSFPNRRFDTVVRYEARDSYIFYPSTSQNEVQVYGSECSDRLLSLNDYIWGFSSSTHSTSFESFLNTRFQQRPLGFPIGLAKLSVVLAEGYRYVDYETSLLPSLFNELSCPWDYILQLILHKPI